MHLERLVKQRLEYMQFRLTFHNAAPESPKGLEEQRKAVDDMVRYFKQIKASDVSVSTALSVHSIILQSSLAQIFKDEKLFGSEDENKVKWNCEDDVGYWHYVWEADGPSYYGD